MSSLDDRIRSVLDRTLESLTPRLEADLRDSATEIARVVSEHEGRVAEEAADAARVETRAEVERDVSALREEAERQVAVVQRVLDELRDEQAREAEASRRRLAEARQELATTRDELAALRQERGEAGEVARRLEQALLRSEALPTALRSLDEAGSFGDVLDALARLAGEEAGRAVVFLVKGDRLTDWRTTGFEAGDAQPPVMTLELEDAGLLGEVARSGRAHERAGEVGPALPTFGRRRRRASRCGAAGGRWQLGDRGALCRRAARHRRSRTLAGPARADDTPCRPRPRGAHVPAGRHAVGTAAPAGVSPPAQVRIATARRSTAPSFPGHPSPRPPCSSR